MKNILNTPKKGILMVTLFATMLSFASKTSAFKIENNTENTSLVLDVKAGNLLIIKDFKGVILYEESMKQSGLYTKSFDLTELPDGDYIFELDKDLEIQTIPFEVVENTVTFKTDMEATIFKPATRVKGEIVFVSRLSLNKEPMEISIYFTDNRSTFSNSELIYSETVTDTDNLSRVYKLEARYNGSYTMVYKTGGRIFTSQVN